MSVGIIIKGPGGISRAEHAHHQPTRMIAHGTREMALAERADMERAHEFERSGKTAKVSKNGRLLRSVSLAAVMNAVNTEGPEVLSAAGESYWKDMEKRHPHIKRAR